MTAGPPPPVPDDRLMYSVAQTARVTALSTRSIWRLIGLGELTTVKCGRAVRITKASIDAFIARGGTK